MNNNGKFIPNTDLLYKDVYVIDYPHFLNQKLKQIQEEEQNNKDNFNDQSDSYTFTDSEDSKLAIDEVDSVESSSYYSS